MKPTSKQHVLFVTFNKITGSHVWQMSLQYFSTSTLIYFLVKLWANRWGGAKERGRERGKGGCRGSEMLKYVLQTELHHLDRENTHHSGEPAHWIRLATGSICTSRNQSHSLIWLGQLHRRKRKLLCSLIKLVLFCAPRHPPTFSSLCVPMSFGPTGRVMTAVEVNAKISPSI